MSYDRAVWDAKERISKTLCDLQLDPPRARAVDVAQDVDNLNKAWDELSNALVREKKVMRDTIDYLHRELAEARKRG